MKLTTQTPKDSFGDILQRYKPVDTHFDKFKARLQTFIDKTDVSQSEEHLKNNLRDFLRDAFYQPEYEINTKGKQDLAIHLGKTVDKNVGVIFETKKPTNTNEMVTAENPNRRALHELVYYYFDERTEAKNFELKRLVITDFQKWFIFDANTFDKYFYNNSKIRKLYEDSAKDKGKDFFYKTLTQIFNDSTEEIPCTYFDLQTNLLELYKTFSPAFLLKAEITDDSNALKKPFYYELLHIIGLEETRDKGKVKINRKAKEKRSDGALIELAIGKIEAEYSIFPDQEKLKEFGETKDERIYNIALELCIVWINRILFLKLLEAQLVNYHRGDKDYFFLHAERIPTFNELYNLFHEVLAKQSPERIARVKDKFALVPYLNSSLFDYADIERLTIRISAIDDNVALEFAPQTALKELKAKNQTLNTLEYLFRFLDRHDFASVEKDEELRDAERPIINASVLGKIFEKINGYKDGSIYTPGFITMYMCRQAIRLAVVQKFNESYTDWNIETFNGLKNRLAKYDEPHKILEFNQTINSIKLCDPAVGSGHFLVSALNEIIAVKHELGLLADTEGERFYDYNISIVNDELDITDRNNKPFKYEITDGKPNPKAQRFQKTLFHEKQQLIENCLFGVDINPNSVKICRLRLWIELLKNAYYKAAADYRELETLPNIDINIKEGNSLISRFALSADLKDALKTVKYSVEDYREKVFQYKNERNRDVKTELLNVIEQIKADFRAEIYKHHPKVVALKKAEAELYTLQRQLVLFEENEKELKARKEREEKLQNDIAKLELEIEAVKSNKIYKNAFEWRFEFPEVLDNDGNFQGFDIVIGNPPYVQLSKTADLTTEYKKYLLETYKTSGGRLNTFIFFIHLGFNILKNNGELAYIIPNTILTQEYYRYTRESLLNSTKLHTIINYDDLPFDEAIVENVSICFQKSVNENYDIQILRQNEKETIKLITRAKSDFLNEPNTSFAFNTDKIVEKTYSNSEVLDNHTEINQAIALKGDKKLSLRKENPENKFFKLLDGRNINKYALKWDGVYLDYDLERIHSCKRKDIFQSSEKLFFRRVSTNLIFTYDKEQYFALNTLVVVNLKKESDLNLKYLLSILNSKLLNYVYLKKFKSTKTVFSEIQANTVGQLPIKQISPAEQKPFINLVDEILALKKAGAETGELEDKIDEMVFDLYDLSEAERKIVRGRT